MVKQLQINKAFTYVEMLFVLSIISLLIFLQMQRLSYTKNDLTSPHSKISNLIMQFNYLKSKAIKDQQSITLIFNDFSKQIHVKEQYMQNSTIDLPQNTYIHPRTNLNYINFNKNGDVNKFGSLYLSVDQTLYRIIFHIEKGRLRYEKV
ncbi:competence type IV pilus minor pilin ComGD [Staphylococcus xylosus]|nr:competence type IV pilus minor pilin ComGD [Staphylococcus xylosus]MDO5514111.1 competence type IV pilus minor pilin ComGD [Staphylococcus xylosus]MEB6298223.1 type II secretion system GspH family protein [Staphylococcus xylosus]MEB8306332.1 type II secretion system GspH family protein [Staphylococcus xylosus]